MNTRTVPLCSCGAVDGGACVLNGSEFECLCRGGLRAIEVNGTVEECVEVRDTTPAEATSSSTTAEVSTSLEKSTSTSFEAPSPSTTDEVSTSAVEVSTSADEVSTSADEVSTSEVEENTTSTPAEATSSSTTAEASTSHGSLTPLSTETPSPGQTDEVSTSEEEEIAASMQDEATSSSTTVSVQLAVEEFDESLQLSRSSTSTPEERTTATPAEQTSSSATGTPTFTPPPTPVQAANEDVFVWFSVGLPLTVEEFDESLQLSFCQGCSQPRHDPSAE